MSSSWTILMTCWAGFSASESSMPTVRSRMRSSILRTTLKLTSASSRATRISRRTSSTSSSRRHALAPQALEDPVEPVRECVEHGSPMLPAAASTPADSALEAQRCWVPTPVRRGRPAADGPSCRSSGVELERPVGLASASGHRRSVAVARASVDGVAGARRRTRSWPCAVSVVPSSKRSPASACRADLRSPSRSDDSPRSSRAALQCRCRRSSRRRSAGSSPSARRWARGRDSRGRAGRCGWCRWRPPRPAASQRRAGATVSGDGRRRRRSCRWWAGSVSAGRRRPGGRPGRRRRR